MLQVESRNLEYWYPMQGQPTLSKVSFTVEEGQIVLLTGASGCGKSTLLKIIKRCHIPAGKVKGAILYEGEDVADMPLERAVREIGYVGQSPEGQIVTDKVWHELAFGLESLGISNQEMHRRVAEMAEYFGISHWFSKSTKELSGGQQQILNLASVMVMRPRLLLLDEPTAQLDPIAAERFLHTLCKLNKDFGVTIVLSEQCLEEVLPMADKILLMKNGTVIEIGDNRACGKLFLDEKSAVFEALPAATKLHAWKVGTENAPIDVSEGVAWLRSLGLEKQIKKQAGLDKKVKVADYEVALEAKSITYSYDKKENPVLRDFSVRIPQNAITAIMGGNGSGKTTALKLLAGIYCSKKGKCKAKGRVVYLPQDPKLMFTEPTVTEELEEVYVGQSKRFSDMTEDAIATAIEEMLEFMELISVQKQHPFDLSGGQQQRLALAKLLLLEPDILLLDEPTKGLDAAFKHKMGELLVKLKEQGKTIVMVSHDVSFCAENAEFCGLLFQGAMTALEETGEFFGKNYFFTPSVHRIFQQLQEDSRIITCKQAREYIGC